MARLSRLSGAPGLVPAPAALLGIAFPPAAGAGASAAGAEASSSFSLGASLPAASALPAGSWASSRDTSPDASHANRPQSIARTSHRRSEVPPGPGAKSCRIECVSTTNGIDSGSPRPAGSSSRPALPILLINSYVAGSRSVTSSAVDGRPCPSPADRDRGSFEWVSY